MFRLAVALGLVLLGIAAVASAVAGAPVPTGKDAAPANQPVDGLDKRIRTTAEQLNLVANFAGFDDPKTTVQEALDHFAQRYGLEFEFNEVAFRADGIEDIGDVEIANKRPLPSRLNLRLDTVLRKVLSRIPAPSGATYILRRDHIEITTQAALRRELGLGDGQPLLALVYLSFDQRPLKTVLRELSDASGVDVVLDSRLADQGKVPVTATFSGVPVDTAVRLAADAAGLRPVLVNNVLYVTSNENAARLQAEQTAPRPVMPRIADDSPKEPARKAMCGLCDLIQRSRLNPVTQP